MKAVLFAAALLSSAPALAAAPIDGVWANPSHSVTIRIGPCGETRCGRVIAASADAREKAAEAGTPDLVGTELMSGLEEVGPGAWRAEIFVPDKNIRAEGEIHLTGPRSLDVQGCAIGGLICKTQTWTKIAAPVRRRR